MPIVHEVVGGFDYLMGVKAVWGRSIEPVMCFGSHGNDVVKNDAHYATTKSVAERALTAPFFITIGGGKSATDNLRGRVIGLVRATGVFGDTKALVRNPEVYDRLKQWPVAVICTEIYAIDGEPELENDLGLVDKKIILNAFDAVKKYSERLLQLWNALASTSVIRRWDVTPLPGFYDPRQLRKCGSNYPRLDTRGEECKKIYREVCLLERDRKISQAAKAANKARNAGKLTCEACGLQNEKESLFDAHHKEPLSRGERISAVENFAVLCPTCHRWAHVMSADPLSPLAIELIRLVRASRSSN